MASEGLWQSICHILSFLAETTRERVPCALKGGDKVPPYFPHMAVSLLLWIADDGVLLHRNFLKNLCKQSPERFGRGYFEALTRRMGAEERRPEAYHIEVRIFA